MHTIIDLQPHVLFFLFRMVSLTGNVTVDEDGSAEFRCEIDANPMNKGQLISKDIIFGVNSFKKWTQKFVKHCPDCTSGQIWVRSEVFVISNLLFWPALIWHLKKREKVTTLPSKNKVAGENLPLWPSFFFHQPLCFNKAEFLFSKINYQMKVGQNNKHDIPKTSSLTKVCFRVSFEQLLGRIDTKEDIFWN